MYQVISGRTISLYLGSCRHVHKVTEKMIKVELGACEAIVGFASVFILIILLAYEIHLLQISVTGSIIYM